MRRVALCLATLAAVSAPAAQELRGTVIANGGTSAAGGGGYTLQGTIGQPLAGRSSNGATVLDGGFWQPALTARGEAIFSNGFED